MKSLNGIYQNLCICANSSFSIKIKHITSEPFGPVTFAASVPFSPFTISKTTISPSPSVRKYGLIIRDFAMADYKN